jgi:hypothetical protein
MHHSDDIDSGESYACVGTGNAQEISVLSMQFAVNLKLL